MIKRGHERGFTIVELMIVIVVIATLASILAVMYTGAQAQVRDTQTRDAADKIVDAIKLFASNEGHYPRGGWNSTVAIGAGTECTDGAAGWFDSGYVCTIADTLIASKYLPVGFGDNIPSNLLYAQPNKQSLMVYAYGVNKALVYFAMERPSADDTTSFNAEMTECGLNPALAVAQRDTYGMKNGICFEY